MADTLPPDLRESAQAAHIALTCISTHPTLDMSDYLRGRVDAAAAGLEAALAAVPAQPVSDELIESLWFDAQRAWGEQTSVHPGEHVLFARLLERRIAAAPQAVPVPVPAHMALVPVEATQEMCAAAVKFANGNAVYKNVAAEALRIEEAIYGEAYAAMLAAAPKGQP